MSIFSAIKQAFLKDISAPRELDFLPVGNTDSRTPEKIEAARKKLGRPFAPDIKVPRVTPASFQLAHINEQSEDAKRTKASVTPIRRKTP